MTAKPSLGVRCLAELIGTCILLFVANGAAVSVALLSHTSGQTTFVVDLLIVGLAAGLTRFGLVIVFGSISGAHVNPAVTLSFVTIRQLSPRDAAGYIGAQIVGALLGVLLIIALFGNVALGAPRLDAPMLSNVGTVQGAAIEALGTGILVVVMITTMVDAAAPEGWAGLTIGLALASINLFMWPSTRAMVNPARAFAPDLVLWTAGVPVQWGIFAAVYLAGPLVGGIVAALGYRYVVPREVAKQ